MNKNFETVPEDIIKGCNLDHHVYDYLREFEDKGVIEVKRESNKYIDIRLTKEGLEQLNNQMLACYTNDIRNLVLKIDESSAPKVEVDDNLVNFVLSIKQELSSFIREFIVHEYGSVIPKNIFNVISPKIDEFFDNKFVNLNDISQN